MNTKQFPQFEAELTALLRKYNLTTFFFGTLVHDTNGDLSDLPVMANVEGNREMNISPARITAVLVDNLQKSLIRLLMKYCGLTLHQAVGALTESVKAQAHELQQEQEMFLRGGGGRTGGGGVAQG